MAKPNLRSGDPIASTSTVDTAKTVPVAPRPPRRRTADAQREVVPAGAPPPSTDAVVSALAELAGGFRDLAATIAAGTSPSSPRAESLIESDSESVDFEYPMEMPLSISEAEMLKTFRLYEEARHDSALLSELFAWKKLREDVDLYREGSFTYANMVDYIGEEGAPERFAAVVTIAQLFDSVYLAPML